MQTTSFFYRLAVAFHKFTKQSVLTLNARMYGFDVHCPYCRQFFSYSGTIHPKVSMNPHWVDDETLEMTCPQCQTVTTMAFSNSRTAVLKFVKGERVYYVEKT